MSRNLGGTSCEFCGATPVLVELPRPATKQDCGYYYDEFKSLTVANARCPECGAEYLAWVEFPRWANRPHPDVGFFDLSFRSTFKDEPGLSDLPTHKVRRVVTFERVGPFDTAAEGYGYLLRGRKANEDSDG